MTETEQLISECDKLVDAYFAGAHDIHSLIDMRRELAVWGYRLSTNVKDVYGEAGLSYLTRKHRIAESILDAKAADSRKAMNILEQEAMKMPSVIRAQSDEVKKEAAKEGLKVKLDFLKQVLGSMTQEIAVLSHEMKTTHYQNAH